MWLERSPNLTVYYNQASLHLPGSELAANTGAEKTWELGSHPNCLPAEVIKKHYSVLTGFRQFDSGAITEDTRR